jgi:xylose isomerase
MWQESTRQSDSEDQLHDTKFAARLNSFKSGAEKYWPGKNRLTALDLVSRAATVPGLNAVDLNFPDHLEGTTAKEFAGRLADFGLTLNGFAMRYYTEPAFKLGAFTNPDPVIRRKAIELTKRGIDTMRETGGDLMTLWMGQDGFDYAFQIDYARAWDMEIAAIHEVCGHDPSVGISIEYKPNEPRAFALLPDIGTTLLMIKEIGAKNLGVTLDFAHVLYADEMPAFAAMLAARHSRLLGIHLNDGYGKRDDGLMAGAVHVFETIELLHVVNQLGYDSAIYFDTFPDASGLDPVEECSANIEAVKAMQGVAAKLTNNKELDAAIARQDAVTARRIVNRALYG